MVCRRNQVDGQRGFTLVELITIVAIIGIASAAALPFFITFLRAMETRGAAQELATVLQQARELAIATNSRYRVQINTGTNQFCFQQSTDGGNTYSPCQIGPGTDGNGFRQLVNQAQLVAANANPVFRPLGTAGGARITVQNSQGTSALDVVVSSGGRVRIAQVGQ